MLPWRVYCIVAMLALFAALPTFAQGTPPYIWLEGEKPDTVNLPDALVKRAGWGHKEFLSGDAWLQISIDENAADRDIPDGGIILRYRFDATKPGIYSLWDRVGYEFVRTPFSWRVDNGTWTISKPDELTTDLMELETWNEVAWLKLGEATLAPGKHTLEIKLDKTKDQNGKTQHILYASDAVCLIAGKFYPNGKFKPEDSGRTDADLAAEKNIFSLAGVSSPATRVMLPLKGDWEVCRNDEPLPPSDIAVPMQDFPEHPVWRAIPVPSDKNMSRPDLTFAHRLWYRTRITVPASHKGRAFTLTFPRNNLNTTVYVNGIYCGFNRNPNAPFTLDITKGIKVGQVNEIGVGIRDAWYGYSNNPKNPMVLRKMFNIPLSFVGNGFQHLAYPIWHAWESGIVQTPVLTSAGSVYASDVFIKPDIAKKELAADITLTNTTGSSQSGTLTCAAVDVKTGAVAKMWTASDFSLMVGETKTLPFVGTWADAKLWWPEPNPQLYRLRVTVEQNSKPLDISETTFGFREWSSHGKDFTLNGIVWHGWADLNAGNTPQEFLANYRKTNQRFFRLFGYAQGGPSWYGLTPTDALDFADANGMVVRRCGDLDGEAIGYMAVEDDPDLKTLYKSEIKMDLLNNWREQMVQQVRAERNHPSIHLWSIENEWLYINCINLYGGLMDDFEREEKRTMDAVSAVDPTRLSMSDGGGAGKDNTFPVLGNHYVFDPGRPGAYPKLAYEANPDGGGRGRWRWDQQRPRYIGEDYFATGINPADYSPFGGEETFIGKSNTRRAAGLIQRMLTEGYRWAEYGAYQFWLGSETAIDQYSANPNLAVFCREWDSTFAPGQKVVRHLAIFNDQFHDDGPITFQSTLTVGSKTVFATSQTFTVLPGNDTHFEAMLPIPAVSTPRTSGEWILTLAQGGKTRFRDVKPISVLAPSPPLAVQGGASKTVANRPQRNIVPLVYDPQGQLLAYLIAHQARVRPLRSLEGLPTDAALLIVGKDALTAEESASSRLAAWAAPGRRVLVLEQRNPLKYQGLPGIMEPSENEGRIAFIEDESHPVFQNLKNSDFFAWVNGEIVYRNAYEKPTQGAKSLLQCDNRLSKTAIAEVPAGKGLILVCQVRVAETLNTSSVARQLLNNLLEYAIFYKQEFRPVIAVTDGNADTIKAMLAVGVRFTQTMDPLKALSPGTIAVVAATPANLKTLAANLPKAETFTRSGGWLFLTDLTPEGLADYNKIVGFHHMIRPFRRERVTFPAKRDPLTAGLSNGDIVLSSGERINGFSDDVYLSADVFRFVLDYDDVAPFAKLPDPAYWGNTDASNDHNPYNIVNGFTTSDSWQLIFSMWAGAGGKPQVPMQLPQVQTLTDVEWIGNALYYPTKQFEISTETEAKAVFNPTPNNEPQTFAIKPPLTGKDFLVKITGWVPAHEPSVVGIDNIRLKAKRSPEFYRTVHPLLNIGALMRYDRGKGGIVLCNVLFQEAEAVPENKRKKQNILATLLRNLKAPIGGTAAVIAGSSLTYTPVEIGKFATQFRNEQGWFGDKQFTFKDLPTGKQTFAGVPFTIYQFATSPVPNAVMLKGEGIPGNLPEAVRGIPVGQKADALFFLQTARIDNRRNAQEIREKKHDEMARYIVTYTDGQRVTIPVYAEIDVDDYRQESPRTLPGAQIGWEKKFPGTSYSAVAYVMQWNNPRPAVAIRSVDLEYGADRRGVPVLLALTAATATTH